MVLGFTEWWKTVDDGQGDRGITVQMYKGLDFMELRVISYKLLEGRRRYPVSKHITHCYSKGWLTGSLVVGFGRRLTELTENTECAEKIG
jgi:hypothetical protein